jgi:hypothetical protein
MTVLAADTGRSSARIREVLAALVSERQELRRTNAPPPLLEANRLAIVYWQQKLARRLADENAPAPG